MDGRGRIVLSNDAFVRLTGSHGRGRTAVEAIRSAELHDAVTGAIDGAPSRIELVLEKGNDERNLVAHVAPLPGNAGVIVVLHDVTELRRADSIRRDFVANASHELRTPLTAIRGFAETLRDGAVDDPQIAKKFVGNIVDNAVRLQRLVDDLLELSRSESPEARFDLAPVDPSPIAAKVIAAFEQKASQKKLELGVAGPAPASVLADARALDQVLMNLVDNAVKYTPAGGKVSVRFAEDGARIAIEVADSGPGIAASHLPRIFERFYRVDAGRSREQGGTGLGLAIVKHLVQRMHGEISVESKPGRGSTFRVRLARAP
jgi:two-component system phosphate regulon sensor histidine kinase PhoR